MRTDVDSVEEDLETGPGLFYFIVCEPIFLNTHWIDQWCLVASSAELCFRNSLENDTNLVAVDPAVSFVVMDIRKA